MLQGQRFAQNISAEDRRQAAFEQQQQQLANLQQLQAQLPQFLAGGDGAPSVGQLAALSGDPLRAATQLSNIQEFQAGEELRQETRAAGLNKAKLQNIGQGAQFAKIAGVTGGLPGMISALEQRKQDLIRDELPTNDTDLVLERARAGDIDGANALLDEAIGAARTGIGGQGTGRWMKGSATIDDKTGETVDTFHRLLPNGDIETKKVPVGKGLKSDAQEKADIEVAKKKKLKQLELQAQVGTDLGKRINDRVFGFIDEGAKQIDLLETLDKIDSIDVKTGAFEPFKGELAAMANGLGLDGTAILGVDPGDQQAFRSQTEKLLKDSLQLNNGVQTDGDAERERKTFQQLTNEEDANQFISHSLRAGALRKQERGKFLDDKIINEGKTTKDALKDWKAFVDETPKLSSFVKLPGTDLPLYFYQFEQAQSARDPSLSRGEIISKWRAIEEKGKQEQRGG